MSTRLNSLQARDIAHHLHPFTNLVEHQAKGPMVITHGKGVMIYDDAGNEYIDSGAGLWSVALGYGEKRLVEAAAKQMERLPYYHNFRGASNEPVIELSEKLIAHAAGEDVESVLQQFRLRGERHRGQDRVVLQQRDGPAAQEEDHRRDEGLSRRHHRGGEPLRPAAHASRFRSADRQYPATPTARITTATASQARARRRSPAAWPTFSMR